MSFLETGNDRFKWVTAAPQRSIRRDPGCSQCGRTLEMNAQGLFDPSGKCQNCANPVFEDFEDFEDFSD
jgi:hypothetical protein